MPEWDVVSESIDGDRLLLGEAKCAARPFDRLALERAVRELASRPAPALPKKYAGCELVRAVLVPEIETEVAAEIERESLVVVTASDFIRVGG